MSGEGKFIDGLMVGNIKADGIILGGVGGMEVVVTTNVITPEEAGKTFILSLAGGFTSTLPSPVAGAKFKFIVGIAPTTAYIIVTKGSANIIHGQITTGDINSATDTGSAAGSDTITFAANKSIKGDWIELVSDGTSWFLSGTSILFDGIAATVAS